MSPLQGTLHPTLLASSTFRNEEETCTGAPDNITKGKTLDRHKTVTWTRTATNEAPAEGRSGLKNHGNDREACEAVLLLCDFIEGTVDMKGTPLEI